VDRSHLTDRQRAILQRVADGDDLADAPAGDKRSTGALHDCGLVAVRRSPWQAAITDAGRFYLEHGRYPDKTRNRATVQVKRHAEQRPSTSNETRAQPAATSSLTPASRKRSPPHTTARISAERRTAAVELVDELIAMGEKVVKPVDEAVLTHWRRVIDFAKRNQLVPAGKRIEKTRTKWGELRIRLLSGPHPNSRNDLYLSVVPVPTELRDLHPVVKSLQDDSGRLSMGASLRHRCLLYFHGLTQEAGRRGYTVQEQPIAPEHRGRITTYGRPGAKDYSRREGELNIVIDGFSYLVMIDQQHPEAEDLDRYRQLYIWVRGPGHTYDGCRTHWRDGKRARIDDSIASVLREVESWAAAARCETDDRQARWQAAMDEAKRLVIEDRLVVELEQQVRSWRLMQDLRQYCDALEARIADADDDEPIDEARRWLALGERARRDHGSAVPTTGHAEAEAAAAGPGTVPRRLECTGARGLRIAVAWPSVKLLTHSTGRTGTSISLLR
jgi:hypothetical protein